METTTGWIRRLFKQDDEVECLACGECCRAFSWHLKASPRDIERWQRLGRTDVLARVNRLGWLWYDPDTGKRLGLCPYLVETAPDKAHCAIHDIKPDICRAYPPLSQYRSCFKGTFLH